MDLKKNDFFKIDKELSDNIIELVKSQWKFFFGFFCGVVLVVFLT